MRALQIFVLSILNSRKILSSDSVAKCATQNLGFSETEQFCPDLFTFKHTQPQHCSLSAILDVHVVEENLLVLNRESESESRPSWWSHDLISSNSTKETQRFPGFPSSPPLLPSFFWKPCQCRKTNDIGYYYHYSTKSFAALRSRNSERM